MFFFYKYVRNLKSKQLPVGLTAQLVENGLVPGSRSSRDDQNRWQENEKQPGLKEKTKGRFFFLSLWLGLFLIRRPAFSVVSAEWELKQNPTVSHGWWVQILFKPVYFTGFTFTTANW